jgi:hypothetical protein
MGSKKDLEAYERFIDREAGATSFRGFALMGLPLGISHVGIGEVAAALREEQSGPAAVGVQRTNQESIALRAARRKRVLAMSDVHLIYGEPVLAWASQMGEPGKAQLESLLADSRRSGYNIQIVDRPVREVPRFILLGAPAGRTLYREPIRELLPTLHIEEETAGKKRKQELERHQEYFDECAERALAVGFSQEMIREYLNRCS